MANINCKRHLLPTGGLGVIWSQYPLGELFRLNWVKHLNQFSQFGDMFLFIISYVFESSYSLLIFQGFDMLLILVNSLPLSYPLLTTPL